MGTMTLKQHRWTTEEVREILLKEGYTLLSTEYKGFKRPIEAVCFQGHKWTFTWDRFQQGGRCRYCYNKKRKESSSCKLGFEYVKERIEKEDYILVSTEYQNAQSKLVATCPRGHIWNFEWNIFQQGTRCGQCYQEDRSLIVKNCKATKEQKIKNFLRIKNELAEIGYSLITTCEEYQKSCTNTKLVALCKNNHKRSFTMQALRLGHECIKCKAQRTQHIVIKAFVKEGYKIFLKLYKRDKKKFRAQCPCGHNFNTCWDYWRRGCRCPICDQKSRGSKGEKQLGEILKRIFPDKTIVQYDNLGFLGRLSVDYFVRELSLAFEYDGEQHSKPVVFGSMTKEQAQHAFVSQQKRDLFKDTECARRGVRLVRMVYNERLDEESVLRKIPIQETLNG